MLLILIKAACHYGIKHSFCLRKGTLKPSQLEEEATLMVFKWHISDPDVEWKETNFLFSADADLE